MSANPIIKEKSPLKARFESNFKKALKRDSEESLGDRTKYIGASDVSGCLRKSYLSKVMKTETSIEQALTFERGHQYENIVEKFLFGEAYKKQVEIKNAKTSNGFPLKPHLDFVLYNKKNKTATVVEAKSTRNKIELYESYVFQIQLQMGLLQAQCGNEWKINGVIFVVSTDSQYEIFEVEQNSTLFNMSMQKADKLSEALKKGVEPKAEIQLYCSECPFKSNCPAITKGCEKELPINIKASMRKLKQLQGTEKEIKKIKKEIIDFMSTVNLDIAKAGEATVQLLHSKKDEYGIDMARLKIEEPVIYAKYRTVSTDGFSWLKVI